MTQEQSQFLRIKKLTGKSIIQVAARHNHREILVEMGADADSPIDPRRSHANVVLHGPQTAQEVASAAQAMLDGAGIKALRKDAVQGLEIIFGLPPASGLDELAFFQSAVAWARRYFAAPCISAIVHNDEAAPHCHVLILPLVAGRMNGGAMVGGRANLQAMQADFHNQVAQHFGLVRKATQRRVSAADRRRDAGCALAALEGSHGLVIGPTISAALLDLIAANPAGLLAALDVDMPKARRVKSIDFAVNTGGKKTRNICSVEVADSPALIPAPGPQPTADASADTDAAGKVRERDDELPATHWNAEIGRMVRPRQASSRRLLADASVLAILHRHPETVETDPYAFQVHISQVAKPFQPAGP